MVFTEERRRAGLTPPPIHGDGRGLLTKPCPRAALRLGGVWASAGGGWMGASEVGKGSISRRARLLFVLLLRKL